MSGVVSKQRLQVLRQMVYDDDDSDSSAASDTPPARLASPVKAIKSPVVMPTREKEVIRKEKEKQRMRSGQIKKKPLKALDEEDKLPKAQKKQKMMNKTKRTERAVAESIKGEENTPMEEEMEEEEETRSRKLLKKIRKTVEVTSKSKNIDRQAATQKEKNQHANRHEMKNVDVKNEKKPLSRKRPHAGAVPKQFEEQEIKTSVTSNRRRAAMVSAMRRDRPDHGNLTAKVVAVMDVVSERVDTPTGREFAKKKRLEQRSKVDKMTSPIPDRSKSNINRKGIDGDDDGKLEPKKKKQKTVITMENVITTNTSAAPTPANDETSKDMIVVAKKKSKLTMEINASNGNLERLKHVTSNNVEETTEDINVEIDILPSNVEDLVEQVIAEENANEVLDKQKSPIAEESINKALDKKESPIAEESVSVPLGKSESPIKHELEEGEEKPDDTKSCDANIKVHESMSQTTASPSDPAADMSGEKIPVDIDSLPIPKKSSKEKEAPADPFSFVIPKKTSVKSNGTTIMPTIDVVVKQTNRTPAPSPSPQLSPSVNATPQNEDYRREIFPRKKRTKNPVPVKAVPLSSEERHFIRTARKHNSILAACRLDASGSSNGGNGIAAFSGGVYDVIGLDGKRYPDITPRMECPTRNEMKTRNDKFPSSFFGVHMAPPLGRSDTIATSMTTEAAKSSVTDGPLHCYERLIFERPADRECYQRKMYGTPFVPQAIRGPTTLIMRNVKYERKSTGIRFNTERDREDFAKLLSERYTMNSSIPRCEIPPKNWQQLMNRRQGVIYLHYYNREDACRAAAQFVDDNGVHLELKKSLRAGSVLTINAIPSASPYNTPQHSHSSERIPGPSFPRPRDDMEGNRRGDRQPSNDRRGYSREGDRCARNRYGDSNASGHFGDQQNNRQQHNRYRGNVVGSRSRSKSRSRSRSMSLRGKQDSSSISSSSMKPETGNGEQNSLILNKQQTRNETVNQPRHDETLHQEGFIDRTQPTTSEESQSHHDGRSLSDRSNNHEASEDTKKLENQSQSFVQDVHQQENGDYRGNRGRESWRNEHPYDFERRRHLESGEFSNGAYNRAFQRGRSRSRSRSRHRTHLPQVRDRYGSDRRQMDRSHGYGYRDRHQEQLNHHGDRMWGGNGSHHNHDHHQTRHGEHSYRHPNDGMRSPMRYRPY